MERYTSAMKLIQSLLAAILVSHCAVVMAQWQWIDANGRRVISDRSPPPDTPEKNILKRPAGRASAAPAPAAATDAPPNAAVPGGATPPGAAPLPPSASKDAGVDKELEAKKKAAVEAEAAKRREEEEKITKAKIENCARAKQAKATFDSGVRVSRTNAAGEREVMDDAAREAEVKRIQGIMATDCK
jgi:type IV secretory pathway VirB10-like protein